jgi:hypothetical protein
MDKWIKIGLKIARPHIFIVVMETFIAFAMLIYSAIYLQPSDMLSIVSYVLSFYALVIVCFRIPDMIKFFKHIRNDNEYVVKYRTDVTIRIKLSLYGTLIFNGAYAGLQLGMGLWHHSVWFYALAGYYLLLAIMRFLLLRHTKEYSPRQNITKELIKYRICGVCLLLLNSALTVILFYIIWQNRTFKHIQSKIKKHKTRQIRRKQDGVLNSSAKFTEEQIKNIRLRKEAGEKAKDVYKDYSFVSYKTFYRVWSFQTYKNIMV